MRVREDDRGARGIGVWVGFCFRSDGVWGILSTWQTAFFRD